MKPICALCLMIFLTITDLSAQSNEVYKEKMQVFNAWTGKWKGEGTTQTGPGQQKKSTVDEIIQSKLDGVILLVEGIGKAKNEQTNEDQVVHHALGILSFDSSSGQYKFRSYLNNGRSTDAWFNVLEENKFQWGFDLNGTNKMRYKITLDPMQKTWHEVGEFSTDGINWRKVFEMNLKKIE